jgi:hypothetical protein
MKRPRIVLAIICAVLGLALLITVGVLLLTQDRRLGKQENITARLDRLARKTATNTRRIQRLLDLDNRSRPRSHDGGRPGYRSPRRDDANITPARTPAPSAGTIVAGPSPPAASTPAPTPGPRPPVPSPNPTPRPTAAPPDPTPTSPPTSRPPVGVNVDQLPSVCTPLVGVNCRGM